MPIHRFLPHSALQGLFDGLLAEGYEIIAPRESEGRIAYLPASRASELPWGVSLIQKAGSSRVIQGSPDKCFAWANGPQAIKPHLFASREPLWRFRRNGESYAVEAIETSRRPIAFIGARACDLAALRIQDQHFLQGLYPDPHYAARREGLFIVAANCTHPAETCFCASTGDGPQAGGGFDLSLTEVDSGFLVEAGSPAGERLLQTLATREASPQEVEAALSAVQDATRQQERSLPPGNLRDGLMARLDHPRWQAVAERCLACGNCTAVCPTCFCHAEIEEASLDGSQSLHSREWDSCFGERHGYIHGKQLRPEIRQRYRQWLTHKLATWHDQFGRSGCVGCGRCIAWCPVGIDITEEAKALLA